MRGVLELTVLAQFGHNSPGTGPGGGRGGGRIELDDDVVQDHRSKESFDKEHSLSTSSELNTHPGKFSASLS